MSLFEQTNIARREIALLDGGRSSAASAVARGTARLLRSLGFCTVAELPLAYGRRADLVGEASVPAPVLALASATIRS